MRNEKHCSSSPDPGTPENAFNLEFLAALEARDDSPVAAVEAESRGPWQVVELSAGGSGDGGRGGGHDPEAERWAVLRAWEKPGKAEPSGEFRFREHAMLWAAALEVASRRSNLAVGLRQDDEGHAVIEWTADQGTRTVGHTAVWDEDLAAALQVLEALWRCPEALARVVDAAGLYIAELLGRRLMAG